MRRRTLLAAALALGGRAAVGRATAPLSRPLVIAHRGASGERPEHTLGAYSLAIAQGADYIEPDLVMTRDGTLVCRHETELSSTTDVALRPEFAARRATKKIDGMERVGWFAEDFSLAELRSLRCRERMPELRPASARFDGSEAVPTFAEVVDLARRSGVGLYPELKHPAHLAALGLDPVPAFVEAVREAGLDRRDAPVFVQCFEAPPLERLRAMAKLRLVQLAGVDGRPPDIPAIRRYADGIGVEKGLLIPRDRDGHLAEPTDLVERAHEAGLQVHAWTFRAENRFLPAGFRRGDDPAAHGDLAGELRRFLDLGVDGVFCDFPRLAVDAASGAAAASAPPSSAGRFIDGA